MQLQSQQKANARESPNGIRYPEYWCWGASRYDRRWINDFLNVLYPLNQVQQKCRTRRAHRALLRETGNPGLDRLGYLYAGSKIQHTGKRSDQLQKVRHL